MVAHPLIVSQRSPVLFSGAPLGPHAAPLLAPFFEIARYRPVWGSCNYWKRLNAEI